MYGFPVAKTIFWLLLVSLLHAPTTATAQNVSVTTLDGESLNGVLASLNGETIEIQANGDLRAFKVDQLMEVRFPDAGAGAVPNDAPVMVTLANQSALVAKSATFEGTEVVIASPTFGERTIPVQEVRAVRFGELDEKVADSWKELGARASRDDLLAFRKGDILDYVSGAVGKVNADGVTIRVRDRDLAAPLDRIFGIVFTARGEPDRSKGINVKTVSGETIVVGSVALKEQQLELSLRSGIKLSAPVTQFSTVDFGGGRIRFLADMPFDESQSKSPNDEYIPPWFVSKNAPAGSGGRDPFLVGGETYRRGLWLHSGAVLRFRLNREFSKFKGLAGFELTHETYMPRFDPSVRLVVLGDDKELYSRDFAWTDDPENLELDLTDVRDLVIRVESQSPNPGILEHFALVDAQVVQ